jgi:hypothetical protein
MKEDPARKFPLIFFLQCDWAAVPDPHSGLAMNQEARE